MRDAFHPEGEKHYGFVVVLLLKMIIWSSQLFVKRFFLLKENKQLLESEVKDTAELEFFKAYFICNQLAKSICEVDS